MAQDLSPASAGQFEEDFTASPLPDTPSKALIPLEEDEETSSFLESPSKVAETSVVFQSPSKIDTTMHDITMMSDYHGASATPFQAYSFATTDLSDVAKKLSYVDLSPEFVDLANPFLQRTLRPRDV